MTFAQQSVGIAPGASNFHDVVLSIVPPPGTVANDYSFRVLATSTTKDGISDSADGSLMVLELGVAVDVTPDTGSPDSRFQMLVTNTGQTTETYDLSIAASAALIATLKVTLAINPSRSLSPVAAMSRGRRRLILQLPAAIRTPQTLRTLVAHCPAVLSHSLPMKGQS